MEDQNQNNINKGIAGDTAEPAATGDNNAELEACKKQAEEHLNNWKRERADFVNYKKDEAKKMAEFVMFANEDLILELLEFYDDFLLTYGKLMPLKINEELNKWADGLLEVGEKFRSILKKYEVEKIKVEGEKFDPLKHEAVESEEGGEKLEEIRAGYTMHGRVIRPARVKLIK